MASHPDSLSAVTPATCLITKFRRSHQNFKRLEALYTSLRFYERDTGDLFHALAQERARITRLIERMVLHNPLELFSRCRRYVPPPRIGNPLQRTTSS